MEASDALFAMLSLALHQAPLFLVWCAAIGAGVYLLPRSRPAALCLMGAGAIEILRLGLHLLAVPLPILLLESGTFGSSGLRAFAIARGLISVVLVLVSHVLLLGAIFGWRGSR